MNRLLKIEKQSNNTIFTNPVETIFSFRCMVEPGMFYDANNRVACYTKQLKNMADFYEKIMNSWKRCVCSMENRLLPPELVKSMKQCCNQFRFIHNLESKFWHKMNAELLSFYCPASCVKEVNYLMYNIVCQSLLPTSFQFWKQHFCIWLNICITAIE